MSETTNTTTLPSYLTAEERRIAEQFPSDVEGHALSVLHDNGLYRHLRSVNPGHPFCWFEVITWPGSLAVRGDMGGGYIFSRVEDMFQFFRSPAGKPYRINPSYWAEKLPDCGRSVEVHSEAVFRGRLNEALAEYEEEHPELLARHERDYGDAKWPPPPMTPDEARKLVADYEQDDRLRFEDGARELLNELERAGVVSETWEWTFTDYDWPFLWACHAIVWAVDRYDHVKAGSDG